jgi:soluble lytic murein transglycosylase-like protein
MDKETAAILIASGGILMIASTLVVAKSRPGQMRPLVAGSISLPNQVMRWDEYIHHASVSFQIPKAMIAAIIELESSGREKVTGAAGEIGLMQIKCETAKMVGLSGDCEQLFDPQTNIIYGTKYLRWQWRRYHGEIPKVFSAYNAGTATSANQTYVDKAISAYHRYLAQGY